jgi:hypothetical protein
MWGNHPLAPPYRATFLGGHASNSTARIKARIPNCAWHTLTAFSHILGARVALVQAGLRCCRYNGALTEVHLRTVSLVIQVHMFNGGNLFDIGIGGLVLHHEAAK